MTTLITGSNGFIGQHLINYFLEKEYNLDEVIYLLSRNKNNDILNDIRILKSNNYN